VRNLLGRLHERPARSLAGIASAWGIDLRGRDLHQDVARLFTVLTDPWSLPLMFETLSPSQTRLLAHLVGRDGSESGHDIAGALETDFDEIRDDVQALYRAGLVFAEQVEAGVDGRGETRLFVPREIAHAFQRGERERSLPDPEGEDIDALLDRLDDAELAELAGRLGYTVVPAVAHRPDLVEYLRRRLSEPNRLASVDSTLDGPSRDLWHWLQTTGRSYPAPARASLGLSSDQLREAIHELASLGLIWRGYDNRGKLEIVVPVVIREPRPLPREEPPDLVTLDDSEVDATPFTTAYPAAWDLLTLLRETQAARTQTLARVLRGGAEDLSAAAARRLATTLWNGSDTPPTGYLEFLGAIAESLGLIDASDPPRLTDQVRPWTRLGFAEQQERLFQTWSDWREWHESRGRESIQVWGADWPAFRTLLLADLAAVPDASWFTAASFAERFAVTHPDALGRHFTASLNREHVDRRADARRTDTIRFAAELTLLGACAWLGLVQTGRSRRRGYACRVTDTGLWLLGQRDDAPAMEELGEHALSVQPGFEVFLLQPSPRTIWTLSGVADIVELDRVPVFQLTEESTHRALDAGASIDQVQRALQSLSGAPLPENVSFRLREWASAYRRATLGWALVLEFSHHDDADRLRGDLDEAGLSVELMARGRLAIWADAPDRMGAIAQQVQHLARQRGLTARWRSGR
jgi:hypothetical protein